MFRTAYRCAHIGVALGCFVVVPLLVRAHEQQILQVGGQDYLFLAGFRSDPVPMGEPTAFDFWLGAIDKKTAQALSLSQAQIIALPESFEPAMELYSTLRMSVSVGEEQRVLNSIPPFLPEVRRYQAHFYPTTRGPYTFNIDGVINGIGLKLAVTCVKAESHREADVLSPALNAPEVLAYRGEIPVVIRKSKVGSTLCPVDKSKLAFPPLAAGEGTSAGEPKAEDLGAKSPEAGPSASYFLGWPGGIAAAAAVLLVGGAVIILWRRRRREPQLY